VNARLSAPRSLAGAAVAAVKELAAIPCEDRRHKPHPSAEGLLPEIGSGQSPGGYPVAGEVPILLEEAAASA
jgi:hypothetical protein